MHNIDEEILPIFHSYKTTFKCFKAFVQFGIIVNETAIKLLQNILFTGLSIKMQSIVIAKAITLSQGNFMYCSVVCNNDFGIIYVKLQ